MMTTMTSIVTAKDVDLSTDDGLIEWANSLNATAKKSKEAPRDEFILSSFYVMMNVVVNAFEARKFIGQPDEAYGPCDYMVSKLKFSKELRKAMQEALMWALSELKSGYTDGTVEKLVGKPRQHVELTWKWQLNGRAIPEMILEDLWDFDIPEMMSKGKTEQECIEVLAEKRYPTIKKVVCAEACEIHETKDTLEKALQLYLDVLQHTFCYS